MTHSGRVDDEAVVDDEDVDGNDDEDVDGNDNDGEVRVDEISDEALGKDDEEEEICQKSESAGGRSYDEDDADGNKTKTEDCSVEGKKRSLFRFVDNKKAPFKNSMSIPWVAVGKIPTRPIDKDSVSNSISIILPYSFSSR